MGCQSDSGEQPLQTFSLVGSACRNASNCRLHPWAGMRSAVSCEISHTQGRRDLSQASPSHSLRNPACWKLLRHWGCCPQPQTGPPYFCILCRINASSVLAMSMHQACLAEEVNELASDWRPAQEHAQLVVHRSLCAVRPGPCHRVLPPRQQHWPHCSAGMPAITACPAHCLDIECLDAAFLIVHL